MRNEASRHRPVVARLVGGLGNQMFQYAAAVALARQQDRSLLLDLSSFITYRDWPYQLDRLQVPQNLHYGEPVKGPVSGSLIDRVFRKVTGGGIYQRGTYREPHFHFDPGFFELAGEQILIEGYFQSPRYFAGAEDLIRQRFKPITPLTSTAQSWLERVRDFYGSVSVHIRRGDYVTTKHGAASHGGLDMGYYQRAMALMRELVPGCVFFVFSDDCDFARETLGDLPDLHVVNSDPSAPWEDMFLMAECDHNIIANSSYSWWGAWLNTAADKRVIAPARWFTSDKLATCNVLDLYPDEWILLK